VLDGLLILDAPAFLALQRRPAVRAVAAGLAEQLDVGIGDGEHHLPRTAKIIGQLGDAPEGAQVADDLFGLFVARHGRGAGLLLADGGRSDEYEQEGEGKTCHRSLR
jgi:hypothetical protein